MTPKIRLRHNATLDKIGVTCDGSYSDCAAGTLPDTETRYQTANLGTGGSSGKIDLILFLNLSPATSLIRLRPGFDRRVQR